MALVYVTSGWQHVTALGSAQWSHRCSPPAAGGRCASLACKQNGAPMQRRRRLGGHGGLCVTSHTSLLLLPSRCVRCAGWRGASALGGLQRAHRCCLSAPRGRITRFTCRPGAFGKARALFGLLATYLRGNSAFERSPVSHGFVVYRSL
jgi:hypothetical protein